MIVDANVILAALLGHSLPFLAAVREAGMELDVPAHQVHEVRRILHHKFGLDVSRVEDELQRLNGLIELVERDVYDGAEHAARGRLAPSGQSDWPVLAAAMTLERPILSNDRDFFGVGVAVWSTSVLRFELESLNA